MLCKEKIIINEVNKTLTLTYLQIYLYIFSTINIRTKNRQKQPHSLSNDLIQFSGFPLNNNIVTLLLQYNFIYILVSVCVYVWSHLIF